MSRTFFAGSLFFVLLLALVLFQVKYKVVELENNLSKVNAEIFATEEALHILKAEWAYRTSPRRLNQLAVKYLKMTLCGADQMVFEEGEACAEGSERSFPPHQRREKK